MISDRDQTKTSKGMPAWVRKSAALILSFAMLLLFSSCSIIEDLDLPFDLPFLPEEEKTDVFEPRGNAIYVRENGTVVSVERSDFSEPYLDLEEFRGFVAERINAYNQNSHELLQKAGAAYTQEDVQPVNLSGLFLEGKEAVLRLEYWSPSDYLAFQGDYNPPVTELSFSTIGKAREQGAAFPYSFKTPKGEEAAAADFLKHEEWFVVTVTAADGNAVAYPVQVQGTIKYVTENASQVTMDTARVPAGETVIIVFK